MNNVLDEGNNPCSSCGICGIVCPAQAITIEHDKDGFYRPAVNDDVCNNCGLCKKICYKYLEYPETFASAFETKQVYGAWSRDKHVVLNSSSGGVGHEIVRQAVKDGFEVAGVVFDPQTDVCKHIIGRNEKEIEKFRSSKYLQSYTVDAFSKFEKGKKYLVVGTPCQIFGLRKFVKLKKWEENFILVDFFCHGTPSYFLWMKYKEYIQRKTNISDIEDVNFRNKERVSWHSFAMKITDTTSKKYEKVHKNDLFFKFFLSNTCLNKSCYSCLLRLDNCESDIRLADFWGHKYSKNKTGVSLVISNTEIGEKTLGALEDKVAMERCTIEELHESQSTRFISPKKESERVLNHLKSNKKIEEIYKLTIRPNLGFRIKQNLKKVIWYDKIKGLLK